MPAFEPDFEDDGPGVVRTLEELAALRDDLHSTSAIFLCFLTVQLTQRPYHHRLLGQSMSPSICRRYMFIAPQLPGLPGGGVRGLRDHDQHRLACVEPGEGEAARSPRPTHRR